MHNLRAGDGKGPGLDSREEIKKILQWDVRGCIQTEVVEDFKAIPPGPVAVVIQLLLSLGCRKFHEFLSLQFVCGEMGQEFEEVATRDRLDVPVRSHTI